MDEPALVFAGARAGLVEHEAALVFDVLIRRLGRGPLFSCGSERKEPCEEEGPADCAI